MRILILAGAVFSFGFEAVELSKEHSFPFTENLVQLPLPESINSIEVPSALFKYPAALRPFINSTALTQRLRRENSTNDEVITDEDVADISDDDDDESHKMNRAHFDGNKTTITISTEAGLELYQHWLNQAISGLMAVVATKKLQSVPDYFRAAHQACAKNASTVTAHAKCVVVLLDAELRYQDWKSRFEKAKRIARLRRRFFPKRVILKEAKGKTSGDSGHSYTIKIFRRSSRRPNPFRLQRMKFSRNNYLLKKPTEYFPDENGWIGSFRMRAKRALDNNFEDWRKSQQKIEPIQKSSYSLLQGTNLSPISLLAKKLVHTVRLLKNKDKEYKSWQKIIGEVKQEGEKLKEKHKMKKMLEERLDLFKDALRDEGIEKSLMKSSIFENDISGKKTERMMRKAKKQEKTLSLEDKMMQMPMKLIREAMKLGMMLSGHNISNFDRQSFKLMSPRLLALVPEGIDEDMINLLSPSLFALHNEGKDIEDDLSLLKALKLFDEQGHQEWLNFVIEASGVSDAVMKMKDTNEAEERRMMDERYYNDEKQPLFFTKKNVTDMYGKEESKKIDIMEELQNSFSLEQTPRTCRLSPGRQETDQFFTACVKFCKSTETEENIKKTPKRLVCWSVCPKNQGEEHKDRYRVQWHIRSYETKLYYIQAIALHMLQMNSTGYTVMNQQQLDLVYGPGSPFSDSSTHARLRNISAAEIPGAVESTIRGIASEVVAFKAQRRKDIILSPLLLSSIIADPATASQSLVLSPVLLTPLVFSPAIFGGVILSPWAFVPVLVSPRLLSPVIISPILLSPVILSPLAFDPLVLSPGALAPFILTPLVLSPFIINPVVLAPLILSPFCLSPFIIVPNALSPLILSPFVLSPLILSPVAVSAFVLSPYALSPVILSPGKLFTSVLSPTWLS